jgi:tripartite-type tricarboxylate transporter receptor subunit TctC
MFFQARVLYRKLPYDLEKDIAPIAVFPTGPLALAATEASGIRDFKSLIERAKTTRTTMGNYVTGSYQQILAETWNREHGCKFELINYKGEVPMWVDMASGQIDVAIGSYQAFAKVRDKGLRPIGVTGRARSPRMPEVPTMIEQGFSGPVARLEAAIPMVAHASVPAQVLDFLGKVAVETNDTARSRTMRDSMGITEGVAGRAEALRMWREDGPVWIREVQALKLPVT